MHYQSPREEQNNREEGEAIVMSFIRGVTVDPGRLHVVKGFFKFDPVALTRQMTGRKVPQIFDAYFTAAAKIVTLFILRS